MAGRLTTTTSTFMEDREALKREAARERQNRGAMSGTLTGNGTQGRTNRKSVMIPHSGLNPGLFGAPVKVEQEDATSIMIKNILGDYQMFSSIIQGSSLAISQGPSSHAGSSQQSSQSLQPTRRPQQAGPPPVENRPQQRQPNGQGSSPIRGLQPQQNPKQVAISQAPNHSKPPLMTAAARKSHTAEPGASMKQMGQDLVKKSSAPLQNNVPFKPSTNSSSSNNSNSNLINTSNIANNNNISSSNNSGSNNNNNNVASSKPVATPDMNRVEEVLKEMRVPPLLPNFEEIERRELRRNEARGDRQRNATSLTTSSFRHMSPQIADVMAGDMPSFTSSLGLSGLSQFPIEPPPTALSPMRSPQNRLSSSATIPTTAAMVTTATLTTTTTTTTTNIPSSHNQRLHNQVPSMPSQQVVPPVNPPGASTAAAATANLNKKAFELPRPQAPVSCLSSPSSSESDDDDDHESASQEDSQDSDVEQKSMRMNATFDKSFASAEKFPDKSNQFGESGGAPSLFPLQRVPQLQVQPPNSTEAHSIESPLSASDADTNAEESKASWSLAALMSGATPNSIASSVKSPVKSSPRRSPTPSCESATANKTATGRDVRNEYHRNRKRGLSGTEYNKEPSSIEPPTSSIKKRKPAPVGRHTRSSVTPDPEGPSSKSLVARKLSATQASPLAQNHHEGSNGVVSEETQKRTQRKTMAAVDDDSTSLVVRIPLTLLKRRPLQGSKCDNSSNQANAGNAVSGHGDVKQRADRLDSATVASKAGVETDPREHKDSQLQNNINSGSSSSSSSSSSSVSSSKNNNCSGSLLNNANNNNNITSNNGEDRRADSPMSIESISSCSSSRRQHHSPEAVQDRSKKSREDMSRKRVSEKRDRVKPDVEANVARRDKETLSSKKDEKRKPTLTDAEKRVREDRKPPSGPSASTATSETSVRLRDERREVKQEVKEEASTKSDREPYALYKHHLATNRFEWGMTLSDAAERASREQRRTSYEGHISEAKALKHLGDTEASIAAKAKKYLQSAACFLLGGNFMEQARPESSTALKMYQDTLTLVKHAFNQGLQRAPSNASQECRLAILCLKVQAFLSCRVYFAFYRDKELKDRLMSSHQEFMRLLSPNSSKQSSNEQSTPNGTMVSPANSQSSASSGMLNSRDNGVRQDGVLATHPKQITISVELVANMIKYNYQNSYLTRATDLWKQADTLIIDSKNQDFFQAAESGSASTWMTMPSTKFALFVRETIYRIDKFNGIS